jgi:hypothetical protein|tara:strand:- start:5681 stop:5845 length:165 start_codon:yes stop_codon:yes gene_type:complete
MNPNYQNLSLHSQNDMLELSKNNFLMRIGYTKEQAEKISLKEADEIANKLLEEK